MEYAVRVSEEKQRDYVVHGAKPLDVGFWSVSLYLCSSGGAILIAVALIVSLLTSMGVLEDAENTGSMMAGLLAFGLGAWLWAAHAMDRLSALKTKR
jgi:hypothetical protein